MRAHPWSRLYELVWLAMGAAACSGGTKVAVVDAGVVDAGCNAVPAGDACFTGGPVPHLNFAVVGDTRPPNEDETSAYPTAIIEKIFADIEATSPKPQFVVATGDFQYSNPLGDQPQPQLNLYMAAAEQFSGPLFPVMGNHECDGYTADNCVGGTTNNFSAFKSTMLAPLNLTDPYYTVNFNSTDGSWTAKLVVIACNAWNATQLTWLQSQLAISTTYTIIARHEPIGASSTPPCLEDTDPILQGTQYPYDVLLVGHSHVYGSNGKELVVGNGGAPLDGTSQSYGYAIVQESGGSFTATQYEYSTAAPVGATYTFPH
jgi:hypothetical protein